MKPATIARKPVKLLIVDDEPDVRFLFEQMYDRHIQRGEWQMLFARNGIEALELCAHHPGVAVVITDWNMPDMDGVTLLKNLSAQYPLIYAIVMTAYDGMKNIRAAMNAGAVDFLTKPLNMKDLERTIQKTIGQYGERLEYVEARRKAEIAVEQSRQQYRDLIEELADGVAIVQGETVQLMNAAFCKLLGEDAEHLKSKNPGDLLKSEGVERTGKTSLPESPWQQRQVMKTAQNIWVDISSRPIDWDGQPAVLLTIRDITEHKQRQQQLEVEEQRLEQENFLLRDTLKDRYKFGPLVGKSPAMQAVYAHIAKAAATVHPVLILGESGTGKELIARTIHQMSQRADKPFVAVNSGAISVNLFESAFFGYCQGAFTGATTNKSGYFGQAHGGTLFLDEVGELPPEFQVKLLRVLESGEYTPVGGQRAQRTDVRILAATNRNIHDLMRSGDMRKDFFYRIHVLVITAPPLREHKEDVPLLVEHLLKQHAPECLPLPTDVLLQLSAYPWPGNVRELRNVIMRYAATQCLSFSHGQRIIPAIAPPALSAPAEWEHHTLREALHAFEKAFILSALDHHAWHKSRTADALGLPGRTFRDKLKNHGITDPPPT